MLGTTDIENVKDLEKLLPQGIWARPRRVFKLGAAVASNTGPDAMAITTEAPPGADRNRERASPACKGRAFLYLYKLQPLKATL